LVAGELGERGHNVVAVDLPCDDESAGLSEYADTVVDAIRDRTELVVVAQSFGAFTAPLVCTRVPVDLLVLLAALVPLPDETGEDWWDNTGYKEATREQNGLDYSTIDLFYHDVPPELAAEAMRRGRDQAATPTREPWPLEAWPSVPTKYLLCRDDRLLPAEWNRRVVRQRLGITPDEIDGGHCVALSRPKELADRLEAYWTER
jgi:pimeloyl-ACP methyl ester carboxylesterase